MTSSYLAVLDFAGYRNSYVYFSSFQKKQQRKAFL